MFIILFLVALLGCGRADEQTATEVTFDPSSHTPFCSHFLRLSVEQRQQVNEYWYGSEDQD